MVEIKVILFILSSFFALDNTPFIAETAMITVDPKNKSIVIEQQNLFTIIKTENDSTQTKNALTKILNQDITLSAFKNSEHRLHLNSKGKLDAKITLHYNTDSDLEILSIQKNRAGLFSLINIPDWKISSEEGTLNGSYWNFEIDKPFTITFKPIENFPTDLKPHTVGLEKFYKQTP